MQAPCGLQPCLWVTGTGGLWEVLAFSALLPPAPPICPPESPVWGSGTVPTTEDMEPLQGCCWPSQQTSTAVLLVWTGPASEVCREGPGPQPAAQPPGSSLVCSVAQLTWVAWSYPKPREGAAGGEEVGWGCPLQHHWWPIGGHPWTLSSQGQGPRPSGVPMAGTQWALQKGPSG